MSDNDPAINQSISFKLHHVVKLLHQQADAILHHELGITFSQYLVLKVTAQMDRASQREVASCLDVTQAAISRQVDGLCERGLVIKQTNPEDRREHSLQLTAAGADKVSVATQLLSGRFDSLLSDHLSQKQLAEFGTSLDAIAAALSVDNITTKEN